MTKDACRARTRDLIARGDLVRQPCEKCGRSEVQAHHPDYDKPWLVEWLCQMCHSKHHTLERAGIDRMLGNDVQAGGMYLTIDATVLLSRLRLPSWAISKNR